MQLLESEILQSIAEADPSSATERPEAIKRVAASLAKLAESKALAAAAEADEWERGREALLTVNFAGLKPTNASAARVDAETAAAVARNTALVNEKIAANRALIAGIGGSVAAIGTAMITGGMTTPAAIAALTGTAAQIVAALES